jgi:hypothetical protein
MVNTYTSHRQEFLHQRRERHVGAFVVLGATLDLITALRQRHIRGTAII